MQCLKFKKIQAPKNVNLKFHLRFERFDIRKRTYGLRTDINVLYIIDKVDKNMEEMV